RGLISPGAAWARGRAGIMRVLVVEDEGRMAALLQRGLQEEGYAVDLAATGEDGIWLATENAYDAVLLDVLLPDLDGFEVCRRLRDAGRWAPILMLTARDAVPDRVEGLDAGADDYLTKPFAYPELLARLRAVIRRGPHERPAAISVGDLSLDPATREVRRGDLQVPLTPKEFALLEFRVGGDLMGSLALGLRSRAQVVVDGIARGDDSLGSPGRLIDTDESFAQVLDPAGRVVRSTFRPSGVALLSPRDVAAIAG